jgi:hypothetical protein
MLLKTLRPVLLLALIVSLFSCSEDEAPSETGGSETPVQAEDIFNYIALRNDGTLIAIGDKTGKVVQTGKIPGIDFNTLFNSVTSSASETFIYEHRFDPPRGILYVWDKQSGETTSTIIDFPQEFGENTALLSLDWDKDNQNLVGITRENMEQSNHQKPIKVVRINPENFQITSQDIDLNPEGYGNIFSTSLVGQKLYVVASKTERVINADLLEINLNQNSIKVLPLTGAETNILNLGNGGDPNQLFGFSPVANSNFMAEVRPVVYNLQTETISEVAGVPRISALNFAHKTFYNKEQGTFAALMGANNTTNLIKYTPSTGNFELIAIPNPDGLSSLISIIGVEKL